MSRSRTLTDNQPRLWQLLNCIMDMVEKTRRSLTVLRRCQEADREEMNHWIRRYSDVEEMKKGGSNGLQCLPPSPLPPPSTHHSSSSNTANSSESLPVGTPSAAERQTGRQTGRQTLTGYFSGKHWQQGRARQKQAVRSRAPAWGAWTPALSILCVFNYRTNTHILER